MAFFSFLRIILACLDADPDPLAQLKLHPFDPSAFFNTFSSDLKSEWYLACFETFLDLKKLICFLGHIAFQTLKTNAQKRLKKSKNLLCHPSQSLGSSFKKSQNSLYPTVHVQKYKRSRMHGAADTLGCII